MSSQRTRRRRRPWYRRLQPLHWAVIAAALLVVVFAGYVVVSKSQGADTSSGQQGDATGPGDTGRADEKQPVVATLGDSFSSGSPMNTRGREWPNLLADKERWVYVSEARGGTGYLSPGQTVPFGQRVADIVREDSADMLIVAGGRNDRGRSVPATIKAADLVVKRLEAGMPKTDIVLLSNFSSGVPDGNELALRDGLRGVATKHKVRFIDVTSIFADGEPGLIGSDKIHPTDAGHKLIAQRIGAQLDAWHLPRRGAQKG